MNESRAVFQNRSSTSTWCKRAETRVRVFNEIEHWGTEKEYSTAKSHLTYHARVAFGTSLFLTELLFTMSMFIIEVESLFLSYKFENGCGTVRRVMLNLTRQRVSNLLRKYKCKSSRWQQMESVTAFWNAFVNEESQNASLS